MIGQQFGHYEVESRLGSGGAGEVYLARDLRLNRRVAIKILSERRVADERARTRFQREAQALSRLNHPNIATIFDFDQQTAGTSVMGISRALAPGLATGEPPEGVLGSACTRYWRRWSPRTPGVVHLDLKPVPDAHADGHLKVLDSGIARPCARRGVDRARGKRGTRQTQRARRLRNRAVAAGRSAHRHLPRARRSARRGHRVFEKPRGMVTSRSCATNRTSSDHKIGSRHSSALMKALEKQPAIASGRRRGCWKTSGLFARIPPRISPRRAWARASSS